MERTASQPYKIAVLCSGHSRGSNLAAMHRYFLEQGFAARIAMAVFTRKDSPALLLAQALDIPCKVIPGKDMAAFEAATLSLCQENEINLIALAGFMKKLSQEFISAADIPILNIHPALLPMFGGKQMYGLAVHKAVWDAGEKNSGATVHLVDPVYDNGRIIAQQKVDISLCKSPEEIAAKVLTIEHELYAPTIISYLKDKQL